MHMQASAIADETVAFTALIPGQSITSLGVGQTVVYENAITNVGGAYHNKTGIFTAPGVYVFNVDTMLEPGNSQYLELVVDGHRITASYTHGAGETHYMTSSRTVTMRVGAGSEVWVRTVNHALHGDGIIHGNGFSSFSGWLLAFTE
ncbi:LOW QUALITY PROTEIN: C1QT3-like protein [Mya arenaria]|uniref:C1QT3-like protein n=1 Tax=Mya arenaria TaxID=6604 RepID=A0ABY7F2R9_MYAAR|nr:LOW QUALITY PROTEIN: C1QT3-like protein [Mya arenaria]